MKTKKISSILVAGACIIGLTGCSNSKEVESSSSSQTNSLLTEDVVSNQLETPQIGEQIAVFNVEGYGSFSCRLFEGAAKKAVNNFVELAKSGKYNGVPFHRVIEDFMIQGGDTTLNGGDGKSIYGDGFEVELNKSLHHYNGALAVARTNSYTTGQGTQFYIVSSSSAKTMTDDLFDQIEKQVNGLHEKDGQSGIDLKLSNDVRQNYKNVGGYPGLDMCYTVFGQTFKGQDVIDKISTCQKDQTPGSDGNLSTPKPEIKLSSVEITVYNG